MSAKYNFSTDRYKDYDYSSSGVYFVSINIKDRKPVFGKFDNGKIMLSAAGKIADTCWKDIPLHFRNVQTGDYIIMPEHLHGLIILNAPDHLEKTRQDLIKQNRIENQNIKSGNESIIALTAEQRLSKKMSELSAKPGSLGVVIRSFKSAASKLIHEFDTSFAWQNGYYDHIVRTYSELLRIQDYIISNPINYKPEIDRFDW
jgi:putative transposase